MSRWLAAVLLAGLPPFFDGIHQQPVDATPPPPVLGDLDRAVLGFRGA